MSVLCLFIQKMSAELYSANGNNASLQGTTTVGGTKPLHRFIKGQPKIIGVRHAHTHTRAHTHTHAHAHTHTHTPIDLDVSLF